MTKTRVHAACLTRVPLAHISERAVTQQLIAPRSCLWIWVCLLPARSKAAAPSSGSVLAEPGAILPGLVPALYLAPAQLCLSTQDKPWQSILWTHPMGQQVGSQTSVALQSVRPSPAGRTAHLWSGFKFGPKEALSPMATTLGFSVIPCSRSIMLAARPLHCWFRIVAMPWLRSSPRAQDSQSG